MAYHEPDSSGEYEMGKVHAAAPLELVEKFALGSEESLEGDPQPGSSTSVSPVEHN